MTSPEQEVWNTVQALNRCWTKGNPEDLYAYFHPNMIAVVPNARERLVGASKCVAGWKGFVEQFNIQHWKEKDPIIKIYYSTAIVSYYFELKAEKEGRLFNFSGRDLFTFVKENEKWGAVSDQFSGYSSES